MTKFLGKFTVAVIGGGKSGVEAAKLAASFRVKTCLIEPCYLGGSSVNPERISKRLFYEIVKLKENLKYSELYGIFIEKNILEWGKILEISNLMIQKNISKIENEVLDSGVRIIRGKGKFIDKNTIQIDPFFGDPQRVTSDNIIISTGLKDNLLEKKITGISDTISIDQFYKREKLPKNALVIGNSIYALELSSILNGLDVKVKLVNPSQFIGHYLDKDICNILVSEMKLKGIEIFNNCLIQEIQKREEEDFLTSFFIENCDKNGIKKRTNFSLKSDIVIRSLMDCPYTKDLALEKVGIHTNETGFIKVNEYEETNVKNIYAIGSIAGKDKFSNTGHLAASSILNNLFIHQKKKEKVNYEILPNLILTNPPISSIGLTDIEAKEKYKEENIQIFSTTFNSLFDSFSKSQIKTFIKIICKGEDKKIIGIHVYGRSTDEMLQGFAVAVKMGINLSDLSGLIPIYPTESEKLIEIANDNSYK